MKYWQTKKFKELAAQWEKHLKDYGVETNEKPFIRNTIAFQNKDRIEAFFRKLDAYLTAHPELPESHKMILGYFTMGCHVKGKDGIIERTGYSDTWIRTIIRKYKRIILED